MNACDSHIHTLCYSFFSLYPYVVVDHACYLSPGEAETGRPRISGHPGVPRDLISK